MTTLTRRIATALALCLVLAISACSGASDDANDGLLVVATTSVLGDIAANVVGDEGRVEVLIPIGIDSHDFAPSSQQASLVADADLVVANGLGLEVGLKDVLDSAAEDGVAVLELAPLVDPIPFTEHEEDPEHEDVSEHEDEHEHAGEDPHFWMDPIRVGDAALALAAEITASHPDGGWQERAQAYAEEFEATDTAIEALLENLPEDSRRMVTNHEAFGYFANRYGFEVIGVVIPGGSTLAEPSSAELADLVELMEHENIRVIFAETSQPTALAEAVAAELGDDVEVVELFTESLGGPGSGAETLSEMLLTNAGRISEAPGMIR